MFLFVRDTVAAGRDDDLRVKDHNRTIWELTRCGRATPIDSKNAKRRLRAIDLRPQFLPVWDFLRSWPPWRPCAGLDGRRGLVAGVAVMGFFFNPFFDGDGFLSSQLLLIFGADRMPRRRPARRSVTRVRLGVCRRSGAMDRGTWAEQGSAVLDLRHPGRHRRSGLMDIRGLRGPKRSQEAPAGGRSMAQRGTVAGFSICSITRNPCRS